MPCLINLEAENITKFSLDHHFTWLEECFSVLSNHNSSSPSDKRKIIQGQLDRAETKRQSDKSLDWNDVHVRNPKYVGVVAKILNHAVKLLYTRNLPATREQLGTALHLLKNMPTFHHQRLEKALVYLISWLNLESLQDNQVDDQAQLERLIQTKRQLDSDNSSKAVLLFMKTTLKREVLGDQWKEQYSQDMRDVVNLDPKYPVWYHFAYHSLRDVRRVFSKKEMWIKGPSKQEIELSTQAYQLAPVLLLTKFDYATMLKDSLWQVVYRKIFTGANVEPFPLDDYQDSYQKCQQAFEECEEIAKEIGFNDWLLKISLRRADLMLNVTGTEEDRQKGLKMLRDLLIINPDTPFVHQWLAKLYRHGVPNNEGKTGLLRDYDKCRFHILESLKLQQQDYFQCLKFYVNLFPRLPHPPPIVEAVGLLSEAVEKKGHLMQWGYEEAQVRFWRACFLWFYAEGDKKEACHDLVYVWEKYEDQRKNLLDWLVYPPFFTRSCGHRRKYTSFNKVELLEELERVKVEHFPSIQLAAASFCKAVAQLEIPTAPTVGAISGFKLSSGTRTWYRTGPQWNGYRENGYAWKCDDDSASSSDNWRK